MKEKVLYTVDGKQYLMPDRVKTLEGHRYGEGDENQPEKGDENISFFGSLGTNSLGIVLPYGRLINKKLEGMCELNGRVYFVTVGNKTNHGKWKMGWFINKSTCVKSSTYEHVYDLVDVNGEMRKLNIASYVGCRDIEYVFDVIQKYESWEDYDNKGDMLSPSEEDAEKRRVEQEEQAKKAQHQNDWISRVDQALNNIDKEIEGIITITRDAGPGSRKKAENRLNDLQLLVNKARFERWK